MNATRPISGYRADQLVARLAEARGRLQSLIDRLPENNGWLGPKAPHLNPPLWEYGHIVWFQERWCLREGADGGRAESLLPGADALYDSSSVAHDTRWDLALPAPEAVDAYAARVADAVAARLHTALDDRLAYFAELSLYHELMHVEAWWMAFQNLGYAPPASLERVARTPSRRLAFAGGEIDLGSSADAGFIFDNEKWRHPAAYAAFDIDASPVGEAEFAEFVDTGGYQQRALWTDEGWQWRAANGAQHPMYWRPADGTWEVRRFERWTPLAADLAMLHVNRFEAEAYAAWRGRALPTAAQWVRAGQYPGFRSGDAWEWLRDPFTPYPGFAPDPYRDYSQPWFDTHWELRGGGPLTDAALKRPGFRNFYLPHRRDPYAGFRTASAE
ncbi:conserved hypothetical protein [Thiobacillus denitrificans ATCC 25259]|uniref:Sulfatase-modifying factor enzyme domain-containing protein n=1 Tax=Thiobacillus denitrificans (strain ATCC 25259 / T1) TaxID=292415 RepID=Q3SK21_THIDA|nr:selenoneine synthase SenA [Thiobacillus denitrificans]AAZ96975.1 conserved hypothetical protein [Thiobacillus denitrificans ATCC 25259]